MRDDFAQLLIDTYRVGGSDNRDRSKAKVADPDDLPKREGYRQPYGRRYDPKTFGDNLNCLKRYLQKQVGKPWDKVTSEIHAALKRGVGSQAAKRHVWQHIDGYVSKPSLFDGKIPLTQYGLEDWGFYVDPKGFLRHRNRRKKQYYRGVASETIDVDCHRGYELHDGKWFYVEYEKIPKVSYSPIGSNKPIHDAFLGEGKVDGGGFFLEKGGNSWNSVDLLRVYGKIGQSARYAVWKRRATDKEVANARKRYS